MNRIQLVKHKDTSENRHMKNPRLCDSLRSARESKRLSQQAVAEEIGVPRTAITQIENGNRKVSTLELTRFARVYRCSIQELLNDAIPSEREDVIDALKRVAPELLENCDDPSQIVKQLNLCREGKRLRQLIGVKSSSLPPNYDVSSPRSFSEAMLQAENASDQERRRIGFDTAPLSDITSLISHQGIWVSRTSLPSEVSGLFICHRDIGYAIFVNSKHARSRMRFSLAHEYAHAILDRHHEICVSDSSNSDELIEQRANAFAASFLMPKQGVHDVLLVLGKGIPTRQAQSVFDVAAGRHVDNQVRSPSGSQRVNYKDVATLAHRFGVSFQTALYRCKDLRYITSTEWSTLIHQESYGFEYLSELSALSDLEATESDDICDLTLRREIAPLAIEAYRREEISRGRILEIASAMGMSGEVLLRLADAARDA